LAYNPASILFLRETLMKTSASLIFVLFFLAACGREQGNSPPTTASVDDPSTGPAIADSIPTYDARTFFMTTSYLAVGASGYAFSADGSKVLVSSDENGVFNARAFNLASGASDALTESHNEAVFAVSYFPADDRLLYTFDEGGNELNHVYVREIDGNSRDLTPGENVKADFISWSADGKNFYIATTERDGKNFDLYRYSAEGYSRELIFQNDAGWALGALSPDSQWLALDKPRTSADSDIYIQRLGSGAEPAYVTPHQGNVSHGVLTFTPDSKSLYYGTDEFSEFRQAWSYELESGERSLVYEDDWDVQFIGFSATGKYRFIGVNVDAVTEIRLTDLETGEAIELPDLPQGDIQNIRFSHDDSQMAFFLNADTQPNDLFVVNLAAKTARQYTQALNEAIDPEHLVASEVIRYKSFDGLEIPSILYKPKTASADNKVPALVLVHGGPGGQTRKGYRAMVQHLVNHGYAVLGANNRGSSGYGKTFFHLDDRRHGEEDLKDIVWGRQYLESLDWVDPDRIGIIGGSYGGYMTAAALAFHPEAFDVGIDIFGVTNWERTLQSIPPWWESFKESLYDEMGDPETDAERHHRISPLFHAENIVRPLLVIQGANDPRVLKVESDELVAKVQENEVPVEYVVFDDEGHGFRSRENRITASNAYVSFLDRYLK
jgi:dipeptidyl aminopeptidase/acylaminoacyl peptidase